MGLPRGSKSPSLIPVRFERTSSPPMKHSTSNNSPSGHCRLRSPSSPPSVRKSYSGKYSGRATEGISYKQPSARTSQHPSEAAYLPPPRASNRQQNPPSFEKDFGPFGTVQQHQHRYFNNSDNFEDINSMFRRPENDSPINRSERLSGSYRIMEAARNTTPVKSGDYGVAKTWDTGITQDNGKDAGNPLLRSQLPPPNQPIVSGSVNSGQTGSRRNLTRSEDLDRILAKYGKTSKSNVNTDKDPEFASVVRTDTTFRVTTDRYCKSGMNPGPGIHPYWEQPSQRQKQGENDILLKLNNGMRGISPSFENLQGKKSQVEDKTVQLPGPDGPVTAPMHPIDKQMNAYQNVSSYNNNNNTERTSQESKSHSPVTLRRSTHIFPFKETPSGHLVIDPLQIAFESRKISVLVSDPNNNTTVEFTTTKCGANGLLFQPTENPSFTNKNERILHEVKKAMSIQETCENNGSSRRSHTKLSHQPKELNHKKYSDSKKATTEFEEKTLSRMISGKNADTHIMIGDKVFPCHSLALEVFSTFFDRLSRPPEAIQRIQLPETEVSSKAFPVIMDWIVQSEEGRREILTKENVVRLYAAARHLGMKDLELQCVAFLERKVDSSDPDLLAMWEDVKKRQSSCSELVRIISGKMAASYHDIYKTKRFLQMEVDELHMLLSSDDISIDSEMDVYDSAVAWLLHDWKNRKVYTNKLMSTVRFGLLSPLQLTQINLCPEISKVKSEKDYNQIITYGTVKSMIDDGLSYSILDESYKNQPDELKKWMDKTGVKAPAPRTCLVNRKRGSPLIMEKISLLEDASQTKLRASFSKIPEKSSSYTLLVNTPREGTPCIDESGTASNTSTTAESSKSQRGRSRIPKPPAGSGNAGNNTNNNNTGGSLYTNQGSNVVVQELSRPKLMSNSSNTLHPALSDTNGSMPLTFMDNDSYSYNTLDPYSTQDQYHSYDSIK